MRGECTTALYNRLAREKVAKAEAEEDEEKEEEEEKEKEEEKETRAQRKNKQNLTQGVRKNHWFYRPSNRN